MADSNPPSSGGDPEIPEPDPPDGIAARATNGLDTQTVDDLERIIDYCEDLIAYKTRPVEEEVEPESTGEGTVTERQPRKSQTTEERRTAVKEVEQMTKEQLESMSDKELRRYGALEKRKLPCGDNCKGCPNHGPYRYIKFRNSKGTVTSRYAGKV